MGFSRTDDGHNHRQGATSCTEPGHSSQIGFMSRRGNFVGRSILKKGLKRTTTGCRSTWGTHHCRKRSMTSGKAMAPNPIPSPHTVYTASAPQKDTQTDRVGVRSSVSVTFADRTRDIGHDTVTAEPPAQRDCVHRTTPTCSPFGLWGGHSLPNLQPTPSGGNQRFDGRARSYTLSAVVTSPCLRPRTCAASPRSFALWHTGMLNPA